jgi:hypothetical protein
VHPPSSITEYNNKRLIFKVFLLVAVFYWSAPIKAIAFLGAHFKSVKNEVVSAA